VVSAAVHICPLLYGPGGKKNVTVVHVSIVVAALA